jgi:metal-responsive CopG/Arc/MetJ family transcriptional regulator
MRVDMKNVQISFDETLLERIDQMAAASKISRSAVVREALNLWLKEKEIEKFEQDWISSLKGRADDAGEAETWVKVQAWGDG